MSKSLSIDTIIDDFKVNTEEHTKESPNTRMNYLVTWAQEDHRTLQLCMVLKSASISPYYSEEYVQSDDPAKKEDAEIHYNKKAIDSFRYLGDFTDIIKIAKRSRDLINGNLNAGEKRWFVLGKTFDKKHQMFNDHRNINSLDVDRVISILKEQLDMQRDDAKKKAKAKAKNKK